MINEKQKCKCGKLVPATACICNICLLKELEEEGK